MHLIILGATGKTGGYGLQYALDEGYEVTVLVRKSDGLKQHKRLTVVKGDVRSESDLDGAFTARDVPVDAVISFLNAPRASQNPWATFIAPRRLLADSAANAARALRQQQHRNPLPDARKPRLVPMNAAGSGKSFDVMPWIMRFLIKHTNLSETYKDHNDVDAEIGVNCGNDVIWTLPLPVGLGDAGNKPVRTFGPTERGAGYQITRESCARWIVDVAAGKSGDKFSNKRVILSN